PSATISDELRSYPKNLLQSPLDVTRARAEIVPGSGPGTPPAVLSRAALDERVGVRAVADGGFASLIARDRLSTGFVLLSLVIAALLVVGVGAGVLRWRVRDWRHARAHARGRDRAHDHHGHGHAHPEPGMSIRALLGVGISGGLVPCPTALVVLLAAVSLHRVGYGLVLILAFSFGLAAAMTGIGLLAVTAKRAFRRVNFEAGLIRLLPAVSALVVLGLGVAMTARALPKVT